MRTVKNSIDTSLNKGFSLISSNSVPFGERRVYIIEHTYILEKKNYPLN